MAWRSLTRKSQLARDLTKLAAERAPDKRLELLHSVVAMCGDAFDAGKTAELYLFNEVVSSLFDRITAADRPAAAQSLARLSRLPDELVRKLSTDADIDVAKPVIRDYAPMPDAILIDVARNGSQDHLRVIAGRSRVTPPVSEVVVERGDRETMHIIAANHGAQFSARGMESLIDKSRDDAGLQALLVDRGDMSLIAIGRLLPLISDELTNRLRAAAGPPADDATIERHLADWASKRQKNIERTEILIAGLRKGDLKLNNVIHELVTARRFFDAAMVIGASLGLERGQAFGMATAPQIEPALLLMRAADLAWPVADAFIKLRLSKIDQSDYRTPPARSDYLEIDRSAAQRVIRFMMVTKAVG